VVPGTPEMFQLPLDGCFDFIISRGSGKRSTIEENLLATFIRTITDGKNIPESNSKFSSGVCDL